MPEIKDHDDSNDDRLRIVSRLYHLRPAIATLMGASAILGVLANVLAADNVLSINQFGLAIHPTAALCMCLMACALYLTPRPARPRGIVKALCALTVGVGCANLWSILGDDWVHPVWSAIHGKMGVDTTLAVMLLAISVGLRGVLPRTALIFLVGFLLVLSNGVIGLTFGVRFFGGHGAFTSLLSLCFGAALAISINADHPVLRVMLLTSEVGVRTRVMAGVGMMVPWCAGMFLYRIWGMPPAGFQIEAVMIGLIMGSTTILAILSGYQHQIADELRQAAERRLAEQAVTDGLTDLRNRAGLTQILRRRMIDLRQTGRTSGIVMFDLDHFKRINDTHGHDEGDRVLVNVSRTIERQLRQGDVLGRWGGEEFMLIADLRQPEELAQLVERLRVAIHDLSRQTGKHSKTGPFNISASFGVSDLQVSDTSYDAAVKRADVALYAAKDAGRNRVVVAMQGNTRVA